MSDEKLYAVSIAARRGGVFTHNALIVLAHSQEQAKGMARRLSLHDYPEREGYTSHSESAYEVPQRFIESVTQ